MRETQTFINKQIFSYFLLNAPNLTNIGLMWRIHIFDFLSFRKFPYVPSGSEYTLKNKAPFSRQLEDILTSINKNNLSFSDSYFSEAEFEMLKHVLRWCYQIPDNKMKKRLRTYPAWYRALSKSEGTSISIAVAIDDFPNKKKIEFFIIKEELLSSQIISEALGVKRFIIEGE